MAFRIDGDILTVSSHYAWVSWIFCGVFAFGFPPAIIAMWRQSPDQIPLLVNLACTCIFLGALPYLFGEMAKARLVKARIDAKSGTIEISKRGLITRSRETRRIEDIDRIEMQTTDNDGEYFSLHVIFHDDGSFPFRHGNHRASMEDERDAFLAFIQKMRPEVEAVEVNN